MALLLEATNRLEEAESLYRSALAINWRNLGPENPRIAKDLASLEQLLLAKDLASVRQSLTAKRVLAEPSSGSRPPERRPLDRARQLLEQARNQTPHAFDKQQLLALMEIEARLIRSRFDECALELYEECERMCRESGDKRGQLRALENQSVMLAAFPSLEAEAELVERECERLRALG